MQPSRSRSRPVSVPSETQEQKNVVAYLEYRRLLYHHAANEGKRSPVTGSILKSMGMKKGFPDLFIYESVGKYHGLAIEMKALNGKPTMEQLEWLSNLRMKGYAAYIAYGAEQAIRCIEAYMKGELEDVHEQVRENGT